MKNFIARMGYILMWVIGIPEYNLEEKFEEYYRLGLLITIIGIVAIILFIVLFVWYLKESNEVEMKNPLNMNELEIYDLWNKKRYDKRENKNDICPIGIDDRKFVEIIRDIFLGSDWYVGMPLGHNQINEEILEEIIYKITGKSVNERCK